MSDGNRDESHVGQESGIRTYEEYGHHFEVVHPGELTQHAGETGDSVRAATVNRITILCSSGYRVMGKDSSSNVRTRRMIVQVQNAAYRPTLSFFSIILPY